MVTERALYSVSMLSYEALALRQVGAFFCQHDGRGVGVAADHVGHHRCIDHRESFEAHDTQVWVDNLTNAAGACRMIDRAASLRI